MFNDAIQKVPLDPSPRLTLINYQLANKDAKAAVEAAQQAVAALPDNPALLDALGRAQAAAGRHQSGAGGLQQAGPAGAELAGTLSASG